MVHTKEDPILNRSIASLHKESERWIVEMEFTQQEQRFYKELLVEHIMEKCETCNFKSLKLYMKGINHEFTVGMKLLERLKDHRMNLALLLENIYLKREDKFRNEHEFLRIEIENYIENFNFIKEKVFEIVLKVMKKEKRLKVAR